MIEVSNVSITTADNSQTQVRFLEFNKEDKPLTAIMRVETKRDGNFLSVSQFAKEAHVSPQAVRKMINERRVSAEKLGEVYIIAREELNRYLCRG